MLDLVGVMRTLKRRIREQRSDLENDDTRTRTVLVEPLLTALGWIVGELSLVNPTHSDPDSDYVDYELLNADEGPAAFVFALALLKPNKYYPHEFADDVIKAAYEKHVGRAVLTNGDIWEVYEVSTGEVFHSQCIFRFSVATSNDISELWQLHDCLSRDSLQTATTRQPKMLTSYSATPEARPSRGRRRDALVAEPLEWMKTASGFKEPIGIQFPDGESCPIEFTETEKNNWDDIQVKTVQWLYRKGLLHDQNVPVPFRDRKILVDNSTNENLGVKKSKTKGAFRPVSVPGTRYYISLVKIPSYVYNRVTALLRYCEINPSDVQLLRLRDTSPAS